MRLLTTYIIVLFLSGNAFGKRVEVDSFLIKKEAEINAQLEILRKTKDDNQRYLENESLKELVESVLTHPGALDYPFSAFQTMSTVASPDGAFRLFNWNIEDSNGIHSHFCYMILPTWGNRPNTVIEFNEDNITLPPRPENTLTPRNWYGALYYKIIPVKKGNKTLYTIIGYDGGSRSTNKKILDVFYFKGKKLRMGYPIFQESAGSKRLLRRVFFEYSEKTVISVNLNEQLDAIVFDHLIPETPNLEGMYDFYVPDMSYDAYRWEGTMWRYDEDLVAVNKANRKSKLYNPNGSEEGEDEFIEVKDEWINPVDQKNPIGGGSNAIAPIEGSKKGKKSTQKGSKEHKKNKKRRLFKRKSKKPRSAITG